MKKSYTFYLLLIIIVTITFISVAYIQHQYGKGVTEQKLVNYSNTVQKSKEDEQLTLLLIGGWTHSLANEADPECKKTPEDVICIPNDSLELNFSLVDGKYEFNSYAHHRPDIIGCTWNVQNTLLNIDCTQAYPGDTGKVFSKTHTINLLNETELILTEKGLEEKTEWKKITNCEKICQSD